MTSYASIDEAWGAPKFGYDITRRPSNGPAPANGPVKESFEGGDFEHGASRSKIDRRREVREYLRVVYAEEGVEGVCRLLDRRIRRDVRNRCLLDLDRDDVVILFLLAVIAYLGFKLAAKKS